MTKAKKLPDGEKLVKNYILNGLTNAKQAAIDAGYSAKTAEQSASRVLRSVKAKAAIKKYQETQLETYVWSKQDKLKKLEKMMDAALKYDEEKGMVNMPSFVAALKVHNEMQGDNAPTEQSITHSVKETLAEKLKRGTKR